MQILSIFLELLLWTSMDIKKGNIYAIFEYCKHGTLKDFVIRNARHYYDQFEYGIKEKHSDYVSISKFCDSSTISFEDPESYGNGLSEMISFSTSDMLHWPEQIADGMDFLASHKIINRDLAARNVLRVMEIW